MDKAKGKRRQINRATKTVVTFDAEKRREFITGFHKRKLERKKRAKEKAERLLKEAKRQARKEKRERMREKLAKLPDLPDVLATSLGDETTEQSKETMDFSTADNNVTVDIVTFGDDALDNSLDTGENSTSSKPIKRRHDLDDDSGGNSNRHPAKKRKGSNQTQPSEPTMEITDRRIRQAKRLLHGTGKKTGKKKGKTAPKGKRRR